MTATLLPDLKDPRYLDEVGWFLFHERYERHLFDGSYDDERRAYSALFLEEVRTCLGADADRLEQMTVVSIGCGCTGDLSAWPCAAKIAVDPLLYVYQQLGLIMTDAPGTASTINLAVGIESIPLLDASADLVVCRNALDHMPEPDAAVQQMWRIVRRDGHVFISVDLGGWPTPDEPTVFSDESLRTVIESRFDVVRSAAGRPHSRNRDSSVRLLARRKPLPTAALDKDAVLQAYLSRVQA
jgi:SAM-dependent methyltransferase